MKGDDEFEARLELASFVGVNRGSLLRGAEKGDEIRGRGGGGGFKMTAEGVLGIGVEGGDNAGGEG